MFDKPAVRATRKEEKKRTPRITPLAAVKQSHVLARASFAKPPGIRALRCLMLAMAKVRNETDLWGGISVYRSEAAEVFPGIYRHKGWRTLLDQELKDLLTLQYVLLEPDGTIRRINALMECAMSPSGHICFNFHPEMAGHVGASLASNFTRFRPALLNAFCSSQHAKFYMVLKSYSFMGRYRIHVEHLKRSVGQQGYKQNRNFVRRFVQPCVERINAGTDIVVSYEYAGERYGDGMLTFNIKARDQQSELAPLEQATTRMLTRFGLAQAAAIELVSLQGPMHCLAWLYMAQLAQQAGRISKSKGGYLRELVIQPELPTFTRELADPALPAFRASVLLNTYDCSAPQDKANILADFESGIPSSMKERWRLYKLEGAEFRESFVKHLSICLAELLDEVPFLQGAHAKAAQKAA